MSREEQRRFIEKLRKLSPDKKRYFYYMVMGAAFAKQKNKED